MYQFKENVIEIAEHVLTIYRQVTPEFITSCDIWGPFY